MIDIKKLRERLGLTQEELGREMSVTGLTIRRWEKKKAKPQLVHRLHLKHLEEMVGLMKGDGDGNGLSSND